MTSAAPALTRLASFIGAVALCLVAAAPAAASDPSPPWVARAETLARLRAEIDRERQAIDAERQAAAAEHAAFARQRLEAEAQVAAERARRDAHRQLKARQAEEAATTSARDAALRALLAEALPLIQARVAASVPYERQARADVFTALSRSLADGRAPAHVLAARLWAATEDELRFSTSVASARQPITIGDTTALADTVHLGGVLICARTTDGRAGCRGAGADPAFALDADPAIEGAIAASLESLRGHVARAIVHLPLQADETPRQAPR